MREVFLSYEINPSTWFYLSSLLIIGIFFKFYRVFSVRNMDLLGLLMFGPGMLLLLFGYERLGYGLMFTVGSFFLIRLLLDCLMVRRPLLEPNLDSSGMSFTCFALYMFLVGTVITSPSPLTLLKNSEMGKVYPVTLENALRKSQLERSEDEMALAATRGPGYPWFHQLAGSALYHDSVELLRNSQADKSTGARTNSLSNGSLSNGPKTDNGEPADNSIIPGNPDSQGNAASADPNVSADLHALAEMGTGAKSGSGTDLESPSGTGNESGIAAPSASPDAGKISAWLVQQVFWTKLLAILGHLAIVIAIIMVGYFHFSNIKTGVAAATLYLLLPYMYQFPSRIDHIIPAALLIWAVVFYRRPWLSGILIGLASALVYYPWFLIPLWIGFYWRRGAFRFTTGAVSTIFLMVMTLFIFSENRETCQEHLINMMGCVSLFWRHPQGFWEAAVPELPYRIPVIAAYAGLAFSLLFWPAQKNLGSLLSCTAAVMLGSQFCHPYQGGLYLAWFMPFLILTIFRPNLEDRIASTCVFESRFRITSRPTPVNS